MPERSGFRRNIGLFMAVMIGIGAMMGPGIFALPSEVAGSVGPLGIVAYLAMGLLTESTVIMPKRRFDITSVFRDRGVFRKLWDWREGWARTSG